MPRAGAGRVAGRGRAGSGCRTGARSPTGAGEAAGAGTGARGPRGRSRPRRSFTRRSLLIGGGPADGYRRGAAGSSAGRQLIGSGPLASCSAARSAAHRGGVASCRAWSRFRACSTARRCAARFRYARHADRPSALAAHRAPLTREPGRGHQPEQRPSPAERPVDGAGGQPDTREHDPGGRLRCRTSRTTTVTAVTATTSRPRCVPVPRRRRPARTPRRGERTRTAATPRRAPGRGRPSHGASVHRRTVWVTLPRAGGIVHGTASDTGGSMGPAPRALTRGRAHLVPR